MNSRTASVATVMQYVAIAMLIALTGFEYFYRNHQLIYLVLGPLSLYLAWISGAGVHKGALLFVGATVLLLGVQAFHFGLDLQIVFSGAVRFVIYLLVALGTARVFADKYIRVVYVLAVVSLVFYVPSQVSDSFHKFLLAVSSNIQPIGFGSVDVEQWTNPSNTLIIYTVPHLDVFRNSGPFWEPGMFGVFINIALAINVARTSQLWNKHNIVLLLSSVTTFSLGSLVASVLIVTYYYAFIKRAVLVGLCILVAAPLLAVALMQNDYFVAKVEANIQDVDKGYGRVGALLTHYAQIVESPLIGYGGGSLADSQERLSEWTGVTPNGLSNIVRLYGIPFSLLYYFLLYNFSQWCVAQSKGGTNRCLLVFLVLLIVAFSQDVTTRHFYFVLTLLPLVVSRRLPRVRYE